MDSALVVDPVKIAAKIGVTEPTPEQIESITDAIRDCQSDVEEELGRPLTARTVTLDAINPLLGEDLDSYRAWPDSQRFDDWVKVLSRVPRPDGSYDVEFLVGLDGANERAIVRYVTAHAVRTLREDDSYGFPQKRVVNNVSADGQSLTYVARPSTEGTAGALPTMKSLRRFKRLSLYKANRPQPALWPNAGRL